MYPGVKTSRSSDESQEGTKIPAGTTIGGASKETSSEIMAHPNDPKAPGEEFFVPTGSPEDSANFFSKLGFFYLDPLLWKARSKTLTQEDMWELSEVTQSHYLYNHVNIVSCVILVFA